LFFSIFPKENANFAAKYIPHDKLWRNMLEKNMFTKQTKENRKFLEMLRQRNKENKE
jgi:hypothetical protein